MSVLDVSLRDVDPADIPIFFEHQRDPISMAMAAMPSREREAHAQHWSKITQDPSSYIRTIVVDHEVAGNVLSWSADGKRLIGYWIDRGMWGKGIATTALRLFLDVVPDRPLHAYVAKDNAGSILVLERNGFSMVGEETDGDVELLLMSLE